MEHHPGHWFVCGITGSGKSYLAKAKCADLTAKGWGTIVLDPHKDNWQCSYLTDSKADFLKVAKASSNCHLFVDEAAAPEIMGRYSKEMNWVTTQSRHRGHVAWIISQRGTAVDVTVRNNCRNIIMFEVHRDDADWWAKQMNEDLFLQAPELNAKHGKKYHFVYYEAGKAQICMI